MIISGLNAYFGIDLTAVEQGREVQSSRLCSSQEGHKRLVHPLIYYSIQLTATLLDLQDEIEKLEGVAEPSGAEKYRLAELKAELNKIMAKKEEYVQEHPEQRKLVYRARRDKDEVNKEEPVVEQKRNVFNKHGLPRHPERSIYYDAVMNPFGVPPPGMPYMERRKSTLKIHGEN